MKYDAIKVILKNKPYCKKIMITVSGKLDRLFSKAWGKERRRAGRKNTNLQRVPTGVGSPGHCYNCC